MSLCSAVHARAWLLEEVESCLSQQSGAVLDWVASYLLHLWRDLTLKQLIFEAAFILPSAQLGALLFISGAQPIAQNFAVR